MRIESISIENYKGIRKATIDGLADHASVVISGKNGTGKSLILEAVLTAWTNSKCGDRGSVVGPWDSKAAIRVVVHLNDDERQAVYSWRDTQYGRWEDVPATATVARTWDSPRSYGPRSSSRLGDLLTDEEFQAEHRFSVIDFIPADRTVSIGHQHLSIDLHVFGEERVAEERKTAVEQYLKYKSAYTPGDVLNFLATSDYLDLIAKREGRGGIEEFDVITRRFHEATGKSIGRPEPDLEKGVTISVTPQHGGSHTVSELSVGEHSVLMMMYWVRRLAARGGVLLIDEPEQHLHPTLQVALLEMTSVMSERGQIIAVSHSPSIVSSCQPAQLFEMTPASTNDSQLVGATKDGRTSELMANLGLRPSALVQYDALIIVEGKSDRDLLTLCFPVIATRCRIEVAGSSAAVMQAYKTLETISHAIPPWLCVRDRDFITDEERRNLAETHPNLHIWSGRMLENELLDVDLVTRTLARVRQSDSPTIETKLRNEAAQLMPEVIHELTKTRLAEVGTDGDSDGLSRIEKLRRFYQRQAENYQSRAEVLDEVYEDVLRSVGERWSTDWQQLVNGKALLARLARTHTPFHSAEDFKAALAIAFDDGLAEPPGLTDFASRLLRLLSHKTGEGAGQGLGE